MSEVTLETPSGSGSLFPQTHWTVILAAGDLSSPNNQPALEQFCQAYWYPVYVFVRARGSPPEEAKDLTQAFFARVLEKEVLAGLSREGGRFRSFFLKTLKRFLTNEWQHRQAEKRGGGKTHLPIDETTETRYQKNLADHRPPESSFDREWAVAVWGRALARLREEYTREGKQQLFECLQGGFPGALQELSYAEAAQALDMKVEAVRTAARRMRQRYGKLLRAEVATPGTSPQEIDEEIRYLIAVLNG